MMGGGVLMVGMENLMVDVVVVKEMSDGEERMAKVGWWR